MMFNAGHGKVLAGRVATRVGLDPFMIAAILQAVAQTMLICKQSERPPSLASYLRGEEFILPWRRNGHADARQKRLKQVAFDEAFGKSGNDAGRAREIADAVLAEALQTGHEDTKKLYQGAL